MNFGKSAFIFASVLWASLAGQALAGEPIQEFDFHGKAAEYKLIAVDGDGKRSSGIVETVYGDRSFKLEFCKYPDLNEGCSLVPGADHLNREQVQVLESRIAETHSREVGASEVLLSSSLITTLLTFNVANAAQGLQALPASDSARELGESTKILEWAVSNTRFAQGKEYGETPAYETNGTLLQEGANAISAAATAK